MTSLIDFTNSPEVFSNLDGASQKTILTYNDCHYIVKYGAPTQPREHMPDQGSYVHSPISEHLGSMIINALGVPAQTTILGTYHDREVVACEDFLRPLQPHATLVPFSSLENTMIPSSSRGLVPDYENLMYVFANHPMLEGHRQAAINRYWDTFVCDALIANHDRHGGNWGYIFRTDPQTADLTEYLQLAPVYDSGSSLYGKTSEEAMARIIDDQSELETRAHGWPKACLRVNGQRQSFDAFLLSPEGSDARSALLRLAPQIRSLDLVSIVNSVPGISTTRRKFYVATLHSRIEHVLTPAFKMACAEQGVQYEPLVNQPLDAHLDQVLPGQATLAHASRLYPADILVGSVTDALNSTPRQLSHSPCAPPASHASARTPSRSL